MQNKEINVMSKMLTVSLIVSMVALLSWGCSYEDKPTKQTAGIILMKTGVLRVEVGSAIKDGTLSSYIVSDGFGAIKNSLKSEGVDYLVLTKRGDIVITTQNPYMVVVFEPALENNEIDWTCYVYPDESRPKVCS